MGEGCCPDFLVEVFDLRAWASRIFEFVRAVVPLVVFCVGYIYVFLGKNMLTWTMAGGMLCVIVGLAIFKFGLMTGLMAFGEVIGLELPFKVSSSVFLAVTCALGVLVTFAEPGINSLKIIGDQIDNPPPLLNAVLNMHPTEMLFAVAIGVGLAASIGMQRIKKHWSIKFVIVVSLLPLLFITAVLLWIGEDFSVVIGLAWDCGAVTTGPATVPIVLALGVGMCRTCRKEASDPHHDERFHALMGLLDRLAHDPRYKDYRQHLRGFGKTPSSRQFNTEKARPLLGASPMADDRPSKAASVAVLPYAAQSKKEATSSWEDDRPVMKHASSWSPQHDLKVNLDNEVDMELFAKIQDDGRELDSFGVVTLASLYPIATVLCFAAVRHTLGTHSKEPKQAAEDAADAFDIVPLKQFKEAFVPIAMLITFLLSLQYGVLRTPLKDAPRILTGVAACLVGLSIFNVGLEYGSIPLGNAAGTDLPPAFDQAFGLQTILVFGMLTGMIATIIDLEPCGLGETVEFLSGGKFTKMNLFLSVSLGVGLGIILGMCKIIYTWNLAYVIFIGYGLALALTYISDDGIVCVAWDSAGVTTGPVTVPLVLSMGVGICNHPSIQGVDGFGVLTCASVCPIVTVLLMGLVKIGPKKKK